MNALNRVCTGLKRTAWAAEIFFPLTHMQQEDSSPPARPPAGAKVNTFTFFRMDERERKELGERTG